MTTRPTRASRSGSPSALRGRAGRSPATRSRAPGACGGAAARPGRTSGSRRRSRRRRRRSRCRQVPASASRHALRSAPGQELEARRRAQPEGQGRAGVLPEGLRVVLANRRVDPHCSSRSAARLPACAGAGASWKLSSPAAVSHSSKPLVPPSRRYLAYQTVSMRAVPAAPASTPRITAPSASASSPFVVLLFEWSWNGRGPSWTGQWQRPTPARRLCRRGDTVHRAVATGWSGRGRSRWSTSMTSAAVQANPLAP